MRFDITDQWDGRPSALEWAEDALPELAEWLKADPGRDLGGTSGALHAAYHLVEGTDDVYRHDISPICKDRRISGSPAQCGLPDRFTICDRCLKKLGVDTKQEETAIEWGLKNLVEPWKVLELLEDPDLWEQDRRRIWGRWYQLKLESGEWSEDWRTYKQPEWQWSSASHGQNDRAYLDAGWSNPWFFVEHVLGYYYATKRSRGVPRARQMSKDWHGPKTVSFGRMLERLLWLLGESPPTADQVRSKAEIERQIVRLMDRKWETLEKFKTYRSKPIDEPLARRDDRDDPIFADLR